MVNIYHVLYISVIFQILNVPIYIKSHRMYIIYNKLKLAKVKIVTFISQSQI